MYKLKQIINEKLEDRKINDNLFIMNGVVYLTIDNTTYKHEFENWYQYTDKWVNLQGGVPRYEVEENLDNKIFEEITNGNI